MTLHCNSLGISSAITDDLAIARGFSVQQLITLHCNSLGIVLQQLMTLHCNSLGIALQQPVTFHCNSLGTFIATAQGFSLQHLNGFMSVHFNRYMKGEEEDLPDWFSRDEKKHCHRQMPVTKVIYLPPPPPPPHLKFGIYFDCLFLCDI